MIDWPVAELLPHAGDMILLDAVEAFDADSIDAHVKVKPGGLFNLPDGSLPAWVGVEIMAQIDAIREQTRPWQVGDATSVDYVRQGREERDSSRRNKSRK